MQLRRVLNLVSVFTLSKIFELGICAFILLYYARLVGPAQYGELTKSLLIITYAPFVIFGLNDAYLKYFSLSKSAHEKCCLSSLVVLYNFILASTFSLLVWFAFPTTISLFCLGVAFLNIMRGSLTSVLRANLSANSLAFANIFFSIIYLTIFFISYSKVTHLEPSQLFSSWFYGLVAAMLFYIAHLLYNKALTLKFNEGFVHYVRNTLPKLINKGLILALITMGTVLLISFDRITLVAFHYPKTIVGNYQFADNISNIFYLASTSLLYMLLPLSLNSIAAGRITVRAFIHKALIISIVWAIVLGLFLCVMVLGIKWLAPNYISALLLIFLLSAEKFFVLMLFIPTVVCMAQHSELRYLKKFAYVLSIFLSVDLWLGFLNKSHFVYMLPLVGLLSAGILLLWLLFDTREDRELLMQGAA